MCSAKRLIRVWCCGVGLLALFAPSAAARLEAPAHPEWLPPTPAEGTRFRPVAGDRVRFSLVATAREAPEATVSITATGIPAGASFRTTAGNPAGASVTWTVGPGQVGRRFVLTFTAQPDQPDLARATRRVAIEVVRAKARAFRLSSGATETYRYAFVIRRAVARRAPSPAAEPVARLGLLTPERTTNLVLTLDGRRTPSGVWIRVRLPVLPNNMTGWVPRRSLSDWKLVRTHLVVDRRRLMATLYREGTPVFSALVGIGRSRWPTPAGEFYVRNQLYGFNDPVYGPIAFGTSARSPVLTDWPGGGFVGIHGTNQPRLIPGRVSHGCIRMRNVDILRLARLMTVGTPLTVR
jgi:L,D-transpeptidase catalytic domain